MLGSLTGEGTHAMAMETLLADRLFDGTGADAIDKAFLQIEDGIITAVGKQSDLGSTARGATDLGDATLLPGLINMHTHLTCSAGTAVLHEALNDSYEVKMMRAIENARRAILSGVTTIRDCGTLNPVVFANPRGVEGGHHHCPARLGQRRGADLDRWALLLLWGRVRLD